MATHFEHDFKNCEGCRREGICDESNHLINKGMLHHLGKELNHLLSGLGDPEIYPRLIADVENWRNPADAEELTARIRQFLKLSNLLVSDVSAFLDVNIVEEWRAEHPE